LHCPPMRGMIEPGGSGCHRRPSPSCASQYGNAGHAACRNDRPMVYWVGRAGWPTHHRNSKAHCMRCSMNDASEPLTHAFRPPPASRRRSSESGPLSSGGGSAGSWQGQAVRSFSARLCPRRCPGRERSARLAGLCLLHLAADLAPTSAGERVSPGRGPGSLAGGAGVGRLGECQRPSDGRNQPFSHLRSSHDQSHHL